jgi:hypothetical protein
MSPLPLLAFLLQDELGGLIAGLTGMLFLFAIAGYVFTSLCFMKIAERTNTENGWWAWIPILNVLLMLNIARKPLWWFLLLLIPLVNIVIAILVLVAICEARGKPGWWVILFLLPVVNLVALGILAFGE